MNEPAQAWPADGDLAALVGARVKALREERGMSQRALAQHLEVSSSTIAKYEAGVHTPPLTVLVRLAAILDVSLDQLAGHSEIEPVTDPRLIWCVREIAAMDDHSRELVTVTLEGMAHAYHILRDRGRTCRVAPPAVADSG
ncbi:MAG TPA: helix-turn-helix transcriptional regulator [Thermoanaerobaculia bacterium]|nr:helix-turn-helix transcriptional regulator [Thermoanaerobaculia bacterium]